MIKILELVFLKPQISIAICGFFVNLGYRFFLKTLYFCKIKLTNV